MVIDVNRLVGFCLLIKREVIDAIGLLDERFGIGCFEDDDYCLRAIAAGYRAVIAGDAFVHHYGGRTFLGDRRATAVPSMRENQRTFRGKVVRQRRRPGPSPGLRPTSRPAGRGGRRLRAPAEEGLGPFAVDIAPEAACGCGWTSRRPKLSLCMIVRDNAKTLAGVSGEHPAVGRRDDHRRHGLGG